VVPPDKEKATSTPAEPTHEILVGIDGSPSSLAALEWAARQAELTGSTLVVVTTWEWPTSFGWAFPGYHPAAGAQTVLDQAVGTVRDAHRGLSVRPFIAEGHPAPVLEEASRAAELLVVGCRGHGEFSGMLLGSTSMHCALHAHCPVVVVHQHPPTDGSGSSPTA
jgi:nucleotide-binding universal stress UspA family protein